MSSWCEGAFTIYIGRRVDLYTRLLPRVLPSVYAAKASHAQLLPICLSEVIRKPRALSRVFLLSCGGKSIILVKKKAPSRSGFPLSMYVVLKTRHVNPNIHVRRY
nr:MAG TPA: hypothetical protein [Caudoviricetes sp.]